MTSSQLPLQLGLTLYTSTSFKPVGAQQNPDIRLYRYLDFVSNDLTYAQSLKDATTSTFNSTVLFRWYFAWDNPTEYDAYGYPILQGYKQFVQRRLFNPAKQIRWEPNLPIGNVGFQVYAYQYGIGPGVFLNAAWYANLLAAGGAAFNYLMTLQISES
jgi:hypothetical protein